MAALTTDAVLEVLSGVVDPELGDTIVNLGMVGEVRIDAEGAVEVEVALTIAGCPLRAQIERDVTQAVAGLEGVTGVEVQISMMDADQRAKVMERARRSAVERGTDTIDQRTKILAIASG